MTGEEKRYYIETILKSREVKSEFIVQANIFDIDPTTEFRFYEATVYEYAIWHHYYSLRSTILHIQDPEGKTN